MFPVSFQFAQPVTIHEIPSPLLIEIFQKLDPTIGRSWVINCVCKAWRILGYQALDPACGKGKWLKWSAIKANLIALQYLINNPKLVFLDCRDLLIETLVLLKEKNSFTTQLIGILKNHSKKDCDYFAPFKSAIASNNLVVLQELFTNYELGSESAQMLLYNVDSLTLETATLLLALGASPFRKDESMQAPIISAIELKKDTLVALFLKESIPISILGECYIKALSTRSTNIVELLTNIAENTQLINDSLSLNKFEFGKNFFTRISGAIRKLHQSLSNPMEKSELSEVIRELHQSLPNPMEESDTENNYDSDSE